MVSMTTDNVIRKQFCVAVAQSHFVRHNTPHPRELRARHGGKVTRKDTGDVTHGSPPPTGSNFASAAAASPTEVSWTIQREYTAYKQPEAVLEIADASDETWNYETNC